MAEALQFRFEEFTKNQHDCDTDQDSCHRVGQPIQKNWEGLQGKQMGQSKITLLMN